MFLSDEKQKLNINRSRLHFLYYTIGWWFKQTSHLGGFLLPYSDVLAGPALPSPFRPNSTLGRVRAFEGSVLCFENPQPGPVTVFCIYLIKFFWTTFISKPDRLQSWILSILG